MARNKIILYSLILAISLIAPFAFPAFATQLATLWLMIIVALTWDMTGGQMGYNSLGNIFFYGVLWVQMIVIGTFLRGPNWNFFGPFEYWDPSKVEALINEDLADFFWIGLLKVGHPSFWLIRELPGLLLIGFYFLAIPVLLPKLKFTKKFFGRFYEDMGPARYYIGITLVLTMLLLPIKMYLRWFFNFKYFVHIQEFFFNI